MVEDWIWPVGLVFATCDLEDKKNSYLDVFKMELRKVLFED